MTTPPDHPAPPASDVGLDPERLAQIIRVDHAGEYGAVRIYAGQLAVLGAGRHGAILRRMRAQEVAHLEEFSALVATRKVRPTALLPLWHLAGYALGAATAALGERAAMTCTVAVEEAIDDHYARQATELEVAEPQLHATVLRLREEELEHRDTGLANGAGDTPPFRLLGRMIKLGCRVAIAVSEKI